MNTTTNNTISIIYDENIITKIKKMIEKGLNKLESIVKSKIRPNLNFYYKLECEFDEIASKLEDLKLCEERRYFLSIADMILYIVYENSHDSHFGHCNFALEVFNFFINLFKGNIQFYVESEFDERGFITHQNNYQQKYYEYRTLFYQGIYDSSDNYSENEVYEFLKSLKD